MSRFECCGYGASRSPEMLFVSPLNWTVLRGLMVLAFALGLCLRVAAQDENVHIEPHATAPEANKAKSEAPDPPADPSADPGLRYNHGKPQIVDVNLVLVNVTVTDDWNRIVTGLDK